MSASDGTKNGFWRSVSIVLIAVVLTMITTVATLGFSTMPVLEQKVNAHMNSNIIHENVEIKTQRIKDTVNPMFELLRQDIAHLQETMQRLEDKVDRLNKDGD